ncbi:hypothetical protein N7G274_005597 [Stereocaulon virgatum]|uniref:C2H2-type domain-containing protein n=1 Tax=Stereocaulon virgatum TaxID=373712 RepID=A0ABR4AEJ5_9LECA
MSNLIKPRSIYELQSPDGAALRAELCSGEKPWAQAGLRTLNLDHELPVTPDSPAEPSESSKRRRHLCRSCCRSLARAASTIIPSNQSPASDSIDASVPERCCDTDIKSHPPSPVHASSCRLMAPLPESPSSRTQIDFPQSMQPAKCPCAQSNKAFGPVHSRSISQKCAVSAEDTLSLAHVFGDILANDASWPVRNDRWSLRGGLVRTQECIQELYDLVTVVNSEWLERLTSTPRLHLRCSKLAPAAVFYRGIHAMQQCFNETLTNEFEDVFSLIHVACACAYVLHKDDKFYDWDEFFNHMFQWQYVLSDGHDLQCFLMAMDQLACEESLHLTNPLGVTGISDHSMHEKKGMLRDGPIIEDCSTFIDNVEHASIPERNRGLLPEHLACYAQSNTANIQDMIGTIIEPLKNEAGIEAFHEIVVEAEFQLRAGLLRYPREVEVTLKTNSRYDSQSQQVLQRFQEAVSIFCDRAMRLPNPSWRNRYYIAALDKVLAVSVEITNRRTLEARANRDSGVSVLAVVRPMLSSCSSPISTSSIESRTFVNGSPSTVRSRSSQRSFLMDNYESPTTAPTSDSIGSPTSPSLTSVAAVVLSCPSCPAVFRGTSANTNLKRHLKTTRAHGHTAIYNCRNEGCDGSFSRSDNLTAHIREDHGGPASVPSKRQGQRKRRRALGDVLELDESLSRPEKTFLPADFHRGQGWS